MGASPNAEVSTSAERSKQQGVKSAKSKNRSRDKDVLTTKRRCVSTACIACRRRKSKCDGNTPSCAACASVYGTECIYDPNSDHRRKGVYKKDIDNLKTRNSTLQTLIQGILNYPESEVMDLVKDIRTCESLDDVAEQILARNSGINDDYDESDYEEEEYPGPKFEKELSGKMGELRLDNGSMRFLGGTSNLLYTDLDALDNGKPVATPGVDQYPRQEDAIRSWTRVTDDVELIIHLLNNYFTWHYTYFTTLSKYMFFQDFFRGRPLEGRRKKDYCTSLLVNAMLALGCHFTSWPAARLDPNDSGTAGDHFFREAKRLIVENDEYEQARLATVQALALMSVREAGCGREAKGWVYSGMSFRMSCDLGLNVDTENLSLDEHEIDARRITFWGCFLFDKCWSNYLGRSPQLPMSNITTPKFDVFPSEDAEPWAPWTDSGIDQSHSQPSRTRAVALQISSLCEISSDLLLNFYRPVQATRPLGKQAEIKRLSDFHTRLEAWRKALPREMEPREGQLPNVLVMHMFFHLLFIHLFRPFLKYTSSNSPLPAHVSPRKICTQAAAMISKLLRLYKRTYGLRQICNIAVYIAHSACTIHLLNLPDKDARRDISHGVRHLEEIAESWLCARRTLIILAVQVRKWGIELPEDASAVLSKAEAKFGNPASPSLRSEPTLSGDTSPVSQQTSRINDRMAQATSTNNSGNSLNSVMLNSGLAGRRQQKAANAGSPQREQTAVESGNPSPVQGNGTGTASQGESPTNMFGGEQVFEDSKDWWLKDQSSLFDNWSRRDSYSMGYPSNGNMPPHTMAGNMNVMTGSDLAIFSNMNGGNAMTGMEDMTASEVMGGVSVGKGNGVSDIGYLDFGQGDSQYGYNGSNVY